MADKQPKQKTQTLEKWEAQAGVMFLVGVDLKEKYTKDEFIELRDKHRAKDELIGVDHEGRKKWLKYNGYEVTRDTMVDINLPTTKMPK